MHKNSTLNASGCRDMTAYKAITNIAREEKRAAGIMTEVMKVYICSPFAGDTEVNVGKALRYCRFALDKRAFPIAPHCYLPRFMDDSDPAERELAMSLAMRLLYECREIWIFGAHISEGMRREILAAKWRSIRIRRFNENMEEV